MDHNQQQESPSELAALEHAANLADSERDAEVNPHLQQPAPDAAPAPQFSEAEELAGMLQVAAVAVRPFLPITGQTLEKQAPAMGAGLSAVFQKYGWSAQGIFDKWGAEISLIVATLPVAFAVRADIANRQKAANDEAEQPKAA